MTDSKTFRVTEGINEKFEIEYMQFDKKDDTILQTHNLSDQLNEPKQMEALKINNVSKLEIQKVNLNSPFKKQ